MNGSYGRIFGRTNKNKNPRCLSVQIGRIFTNCVRERTLASPYLRLPYCCCLPIAPLAAALHGRFLQSHCASCFRPFESPLPCTVCHGAAQYCSAACFTADWPVHAASDECRLLLFLQDHPHDGDTSDLRVALRLLHSIVSLGLHQLAELPERSRRVAGLLASDLEKVLEEKGEAAERIVGGAALLSLARVRVRSRDGGGEAATVEEVLWAVLTNAVDVQVSDAGAIGIAVYGPGFSWFNHSCIPNSCFRFDLADRSSKPDSTIEPEAFLVSPAASGVSANAFETWISTNSRLAPGFSKFGPRIIVRSIMPIKKDEEVCITYIDLLQPKVKRQADLWEKYRFICCCGRCTASSQMYIDLVLNCDARELIFHNYNNGTYPNCHELADVLDQAITEYIVNDNPEACCKKLQNMLFQNCQAKQFQAEAYFKLQPLHHLCLNAYMTLASAHRTQICSVPSNNYEIFKLRRAAISYSLLLSGAVHHLFLSEPSLVATTAHFLLSAAESVCSLLRTPEWSLNEHHRKSEFDFVLSYYQGIMNGHSLDDCKVTSMRFLGCASQILSRIWPFLTRGLMYLENINSPVDFSWLGPKAKIYQGFTNHRAASISNEHGEMTNKDKSRLLFQLAVHYFIYGRYLTSICFGSNCYMVDHVRNLLHGLP